MAVCCNCCSNIFRKNKDKPASLNITCIVCSITSSHLLLLLDFYPSTDIISMKICAASEHWHCTANVGDNHELSQQIFKQITIQCYWFHRLFYFSFLFRFALLAGPYGLRPFVHLVVFVALGTTMERLFITKEHSIHFNTILLSLNQFFYYLKIAPLSPSLKCFCFVLRWLLRFV